MCNSVSWIRQSLEDQRPGFLNYSQPADQKKFRANCFVSEGKPKYSPKRWVIPDLFPSQKGSTPITAWDFYMCEGCFGVFSPKAMEVLLPHLGERFQRLPVRLNGRDYYTLCCKSRIDCLDKNASQIAYFDDSDEVMEIHKFVFHKEILVDPIIFAIPQLRFELFCSEAVAQAIKDAGLRGFDCQVVDGQGRSGAKRKGTN